MARASYRFASEDEYLDATHDDAYDRFLEAAVRCAECGALYDPGVHPATRWEPAWAECQECPNCGSGTIEDPTNASGG